MRREIVADIREVLDNAVLLLQAGDYEALKPLSDHTIHNASIFQDKPSIRTGVILYATYKMLTREPDQEFAVEMAVLLRKTANTLPADKAFLAASAKALRRITDNDARAKLFIEEVLEQAARKKGSKLFRHGVSMARAAELLGITLYDIQGYVGATSTEQGGSIKNRIYLTRRLFS